MFSACAFVYMLSAAGAYRRESNIPHTFLDLTKCYWICILSECLSFASSRRSQVPNSTAGLYLAGWPEPLRLIHQTLGYIGIQNA